MTNVIRFPIERRPRRTVDPPATTSGFPMNKIVYVLWAITTFLWPIARFIIPLVVFWQFLRMLYFWDTPGVHAGWHFLAYFAGYTAIKYFVAFYRPKGWDDPAVPSRGGRNGR